MIQGYGLVNLPDTKVTLDTLFHAGSTTKAQTAACLSVLIQNRSQKALAQNWSTPISPILADDFVTQDAWITKHATLDDADSHRSGLSRDDRFLMREKNGMPVSAQNIVRHLRNLPVVYEPRVKFAYTNHLFITLSYVIEVVTEKKLGQVMRDLIWDPLGMKDTYFGLDEARRSTQQLASGYAWINKTQGYNQTTFIPLTDVSGAAAVISNVRDYQRPRR